MTREELEKRISKIEARIINCNEMIECWENDSKRYQKQLAELQQELKKLEIKIYKPKYIYGFKKGTNAIEHEIIDSEYNAMEKYKYELSKMNNGWFPDWSDSNQRKGFLYFSVCDNSVRSDTVARVRDHSNYEYFSPEMADQVIKKFGDLWKRGKGIE